MQEFAFELSLATHLESSRERIISRQLGTHVHGRRVMDLVCVEPGPAFEDRARITDDTIPPLAIESGVGPGAACYWKDAFDCHPEQAEAVIESAVDCGFFEKERHNGRSYLRQTTRYPDWFDHIVAIENKPDLGRPGDLETQLLTDVTLGLVDEIVLATNTHVTGAHRNRIPEPVGIWEYDPETGEREVIREPTPLSTDEPGIEIIDRASDRTEIEIASPAEIDRARRRVAERAYGKGWRTFSLPHCTRIDPDDGLPYCPWKGRVVQPATECGANCAGYDAGTPPNLDREARRAANSPWRPDPDGCASRQSGLTRYSE